MTNSAIQFAEKIMAIDLDTALGFGGSRGSYTSGTSSSDVVHALRSETMGLLLDFKNGAADSVLRLKGDKIHGLLLGLNSLGQVSDSLCYQLIDSLTKIVPQKHVDKA